MPVLKHYPGVLLSLSLHVLEAYFSILCNVKLWTSPLCLFRLVGNEPTAWGCWHILLFIFKSNWRKSNSCFLAELNKSDIFSPCIWRFFHNFTTPLPSPPPNSDHITFYQFQKANKISTFLFPKTTNGSEPKKPSQVCVFHSPQEEGFHKA